MVGLAAPSLRADGAVLLRGADAKSRLSDRSRRVSRTATLDGGAVLTDQGYSVADRTLTLVAERAPRALLGAVAALLEACPLLLVSTDEGVFLAAPSQLTYVSGVLTLSALVTAQKSG